MLAETRPARQPSSVYAAVVVALAAMMACLTLAPAPIDGYSAEAYVRCSVTGPGADGDLLVRDADLARWRRQTEVDGAIESVGYAVDRSSPTATLVRVESRSKRAAKAVELVDHAIAELSDWSSTFATGRLAVARQEAQRRFDSASQQLADANRELDRMAQRRTEELFASTQQKLAATAAAPRVAKEVSDRQRLEATINELRENMTEALRYKTEAHPQVIELSQRLRDAEAALGAAAVEPTTITAESEEVARKNEFETQRQTLAATIESLESERNFWQGELAQAIDRERSIETSCATVSPSQIFARHGGTPSAARFGCFFLIAAIAGAAMYWFARREEEGRRVITVEETQSRLPLPIVAVLPGRHRVDAGHSEAGPISTGRATLACETALAVVAVGLLIATLAGKPLSTAPLSDPLGAVAETIDRSLDSVRR